MLLGGKLATAPNQKSTDVTMQIEQPNMNGPEALASREEFWIQKKRTFECGINRQK